MKELVFDFRKGKVSHTRVRLRINSLNKKSSLIQIFVSFWLSAFKEVIADLGPWITSSWLPSRLWEGMKNCAKKSKSSSHQAHCSLSGKIDIKTDRTFKWNTNKNKLWTAAYCPTITKPHCFNRSKSTLVNSGKKLRQYCTDLTSVTNSSTISRGYPYLCSCVMT